MTNATVTAEFNGKELTINQVKDGNISFNIGNTPVTRKLKDGSFKISGNKYKYCPVANTITSFDDSNDSKIMSTYTMLTTRTKPLFNINQRFDFLGNFVNMVIKDITASLLVHGEGGLGKTHTIKEKLSEANLVEGEDYIFVKGYSTAKALYNTLYENSTKLIIFDDCDSVLQNATSLNILKGALDNYDKRIISWLSAPLFGSEIPNSFEFTGRIIFISNLSSAKLNQAVKSRTLAVDLSMSTQDKLDRMRNILEFIVPEYSIELKTKVLDFIDTNRNICAELNMRTLEKCTKTFSYYEGIGLEDQGFDAIKYLLSAE